MEKVGKEENEKVKTTSLLCSPQLVLPHKQLFTECLLTEFNNVHDKEEEKR